MSQVEISLPHEDEEEFFLKHHIFPTTANEARESMLIHQGIIDCYLKNGFTTREEIDHILHDKKMQKSFNDIIELKKLGGKSAETASIMIGSFSPTEIAGYFLYFRRHYEKIWKLKIISDKEDPGYL